MARGAAGHSGGYRKVDVYIVGTAYCGSTALGGLIESNFDAGYMGETARLPRFVEEHALFDRPGGCYICMTEGVSCPRWSKDLCDAVQEIGPEGAATEFRRRTGTAVAVDGSKFPEWLRLATAKEPGDGASPVVIVLGRSPFGYVPSAVGATGAPGWMAAQWWRDLYVDALRTVARLSLPTLVIRNEDLRSDPVRSLEQIADLISHPFSSVPKGVTPTHSLGGNLWVQFGYRKETGRHFEELSLPYQDQIESDELWEQVERAGSMSAALRPDARHDRAHLAQAVADTPGLHEVAQLLGYRMADELATFID